MKPDKPNSTLLAAIGRLLDDESPVVQSALVNKLRSMGNPGIDFLRGQVEVGNIAMAEAATRILRALGAQHPREAFVEFIRSFNYELESGSLLMARVANPKLDPMDCYTFLEEVAGRCRQLMLEPSSGWQKCKIINRVLFHEYGFAGDTASFYDPRNSFMHEVIRRRRGIPITLSIIYLLVAGRCGLQLEPIAMPGRFMVGCFEDGEPFYIDVYEGGLFLTMEDLEAQLDEQDIVPLAAYFTPAPVGEVLQRCCRNLVNQFEKASDDSMARLFEAFVHEFEAAYQRNG